MEVLKDDFSELEIGSSVESFQKFLVSQRELFHSQIDQFQKIVTTQCKLGGVNPLSQEMAAGALSIKIGKRPRDLINPKAVNYMQSVFTIKDVISKKESRELCALFGITVTQIREFFTSQRSRVRRVVRLSRERAMRSNSCEEVHDGFPLNSNPTRPINLAPLNSAGPTIVEEASCSTEDNALPVLADLDKHFVDNIFILMRKEETFSGLEKLMEWILKIQSSSVLFWFLSSGGVMILATWLGEAALEEQTSVLLLILKVLCHLPLHKALPMHMSAILQCVNRLRFYRTSDISNRARVLLSKWSKLLARNHVIKKPHGVKPSNVCQKEIMLTQSIGQIMGIESRHSHFDVTEHILALSNEGSDNFRKVESPQAVKLLAASLDDSTKKPVLGVSSFQTRERRKVLLVDQPGHKTVNRSSQATRAVPVSQGRPMSADDIQKAKMRALFMQSRYGKTSSSKDGKESKAIVVASLSKVPLTPKIEEDKKRLLIPSKVSSRQDASLYSKLRTGLKVTPWEKCERAQIPWKTPAELKLNDAWSVGAGENSKEVDVQKNRNRREKEIIYQTVQDIPSNPKEPWDLEINHDDTLTPEIPIEQQPDSDGADTPVAPNETHTVQVAATSSSNCNAGAAEPDLELLAVLLKNPELVSALNSGQAGSLPSAETVQLLDMIKKGGANMAGNINGMGAEAQEKVEVSLPSPTPYSDPRPSGWRTEAVKNPFLRQASVPDSTIYTSPLAATTNLGFSQIPATGIAVKPINVPLSSQQLAAAVAPYSLPHATNIVPERQPPPALSSVRPSLHTNYPTIQTPYSDTGLTMKNNIITANASSVNLSSAHSPLSMRVDGTNNLKPVPNTFLPISEGFSSTFLQSFVLPSPTTPISATRLQRHPNLLQHSNFSEPSCHTPSHSYPPQTQKQGLMSDSWRDRQDMSSHYHPQLNQNNYKALVGGYMQPGSSWERNDCAGEEFESWSPENSPSKNSGYSRRNFPESRVNPERNYRPEWSRQRGSSGYWDTGRQGNRKWHDQRR